MENQSDQMHEELNRLTWADFRHRVQQLPDHTEKQRSYRRSLLIIADTAEVWGLDPTPLLRARQCNLETLIRQAKIEIEYEHPEDLQDLFNKATEMSNGNFRLFCGRARRAINVRRQTFGGNEKFVIVVDAPMMEALEHRTRYDFCFIKQE